MKRLFLVLCLVLLLVIAGVAPVLAQGGDPPPSALALTPELLAAAFGVLISLLTSYIPGFRERWAALSKETMQLAMALAMTVLGVAVYLLACLPGTGFLFVTCPIGGWWELFKIVIFALVANQAAYRVSPQTTTVQTIKASR